jgi:hypothetical protein
MEELIMATGSKEDRSVLSSSNEKLVSATPIVSRASKNPGLSYAVSQFCCAEVVVIPPSKDAENLTEMYY